MDQITSALLGAVASLGVLGVILIYFLMHPEKLETWASILWRLASRAPGLVRTAQRRYVQFDLQGRINNFTRDVGDDAPYLAEKKVEVRWVEPEKTTKEAFLAGGKVVVRLRATDDNDLNFVRAAYLFVATSLLHNVKRYISPSQRDSIDLFVTAKLLEQEKPHVVSNFLDEYLHPRTAQEDSKVVEFFDAYNRLRSSGLFYEVFLQELDFLGAKVFGGRRNSNVHQEVNDLIKFLERVAARNIGDEGDLEFRGAYCRFGILIVGKRFNITPGGEVWVRFMQRHFLPQEIETVYMVGPWENHGVLDAVAAAVGETYDVFRKRRATVCLFLNDEPRDAEQYLARPVQ
jgi:hypothetical protein